MQSYRKLDWPYLNEDSETDSEGKLTIPGTPDEPLKL